MINQSVRVPAASGDPADTLCIARSRPNQRLFFSLVAVTCCAYLVFDAFLFGRLGITTIVFTFATIWQGSRTYVVRTIFTQDRIEHRNALGVWHGMEYSKILIQEDRGESITIIGEDLLGKSVRVSFLGLDGNLEEIAAFLQKKIM